jgi:uncharacterized protein (DUF983 family)
MRPMSHHSPARPEYGRMLGRGLTKRCPRCGSGHLFTSWFRMRERCPRCGYRFERQEGFFLGAFVINFAVAELSLAVVLVALIVVLSMGRHVSVWSWVAVAAAIQIAVPLLFYPFSRTVWAAIDLMMRPIEPAEEADAITSRAAAEGTPGART